MPSTPGPPSSVSPETPAPVVLSGIAGSSRRSDAPPGGPLPVLPPDGGGSAGTGGSGAGGESGARASAEPPVPDELRNLWRWARGYIKRFGWALAPVWNPVSAVPGAIGTGMAGCCCKDGEACTAWGKHLVSGLGVARQEDEVELVWPNSDVRARSGWLGIAVLTGSESRIVVLDIGDAASAAMTKARFKISGRVLTQETPTGGQHWFFRLAEDEAVTGGRTEIELVTGVWVLGDGAHAVLTPRAGYHWADGSRQAMDAGLTDTTDALRMRLTHEGLIHGVDAIDRDVPWRTRPGTPLVGGDPRTYTRRGDVRRLVDRYGDKMLYTPGIGWRVWTESGWGGVERSETLLRSYAMELPDVHITEAKDSKKAGKDSLVKAAFKWAERSKERPTMAIVNELQSDERVLVPSATDWDAQGWLAGLPVTSGVGRLVDLRTGGIVLDARTMRVSRALGAQYEDGLGGSLKHLWDIGADGGPGRWFVKYIEDLTEQMGSEEVRLLQRAAGSSLFGRRGVDGDTDAVFVMKGPPRSGKSTMSECLLAVAGQYGKAMPHNLLFGDRGNPEFSDAAIYGYRLMTLSEPPMNATLNTTKLKQLSGGDSITGRLPYGREEISFTPECSLWLLTNHALEVADEAVWRRMKFFRFERTWDKGEDLPVLRRMVTQDPAELRLACAWFLEGAKAWAASGWGDTTVWDEATYDEQAKHDVKVKWANDMLTITGSMSDTFTPADMMSSFASWLIFSGEDAPPLTKVALRDELENMVRRLGMEWDQHAKHFYGGRLI